MLILEVMRVEALVMTQRRSKPGVVLLRKGSELIVRLLE